MATTDSAPTASISLLLIPSNPQDNLYSKKDPEDAKDSNWVDEGGHDIIFQMAATDSAPTPSQQILVMTQTLIFPQKLVWILIVLRIKFSPFYQINNCNFCKAI